MLEGLTIYLIIGLLAGLVAFAFLFKKWDLPGWCKKMFHLTNRVRTLVFILLVGILMAFALVAISAALQLPTQAAQVLQGIGIGFICIILTGLLQPPKGTGTGRGGSGTNHRTSSGGGRRSRG